MHEGHACADNINNKKYKEDVECELRNALITMCVQQAVSVNNSSIFHQNITEIPRFCNQYSKF